MPNEIQHFINGARVAGRGAAKPCCSCPAADGGIRENMRPVLSASGVDHGRRDAIQDKHTVTLTTFDCPAHFAFAFGHAILRNHEDAVPQVR